MSPRKTDKTKLLTVKTAKPYFVSPTLCLILPLCWLIGCNFPGRPDPADRPAPPDQSLEFSVVFGQNCAGCHGSDGKLGPAPPLNDPLFRALVSDEDLQAVLTKGRKKALMPAFAKENGGMLTEAQIRVLVMEIKGVPYKIVKKQEGDVAKIDVVPGADGIVPAWGSPEMRPNGVPSYTEPSASSNSGKTGDKKQGEVVFARACAACHGEHGQGIQEEGITVRTIHQPSLLGLISNQTLRRYVITGRPDLGMPNYAQARPDNKSFAPLTDREVADLVALLASWRKE
jgi:cytochrome c oxidase cbb3-type subunit 3/ubiquinol-cytochrome c reductase cytochrome c subunit